MIRTKSFTAAACCLLLAVVACSAPSRGGADPSEIGAVYAECPVCRCNHDLACLRVRVEPATPHADIDGVTYWFCSEECRDDFVAHSKKYLAH